MLRPIARFSAALLLCAIFSPDVPTAHAGAGDAHHVDVAAANLRDGPAKTAGIVGVVRKGDRLTELSREGNYMSVKVAGTGREGWVYMPGTFGPAAAGVAQLPQKAPAAAPAVPKTAETKVAAVARSPQAAETAAAAIETTIAELGHQNGLLFEGAQPSHSRTIFFPIPRDAAVGSGVLRVQFKASPILNQSSNLRIYVNGTPRAVARLAAGDGQLSVPLAKADLKDGYVKVAFKSALLVSDDRCLDERINGSFLHILPQTSVAVALNAQVSSLRGAWALLPNRVSISLPQGELAPEVYAAAWSLGNLLLKEGKQVAFARLPDIGDVAVAPAGEIRAALEKLYPNRGVAVAAEDQTSVVIPEGKFNAAVFRVADRRIVALTEPFDVKPFYLLTSRWLSLAAAQKYQVFPAVEAKSEAKDRYQLNLSDLGLDLETRHLARQVEWSAVVSPDQLPAGYMPERLDLEVVSTPGTAEHPAMFYIYVNEVLQKAVRLANDGQRERISLALPKGALKRHNTFRFVAQRENIQGDCRGDATHYPIQLMPESALTVGRQTVVPREFADLGLYFAGGFDTYLPKAFLQHPEQSLGFLARLSTDQALRVDYKRLTFYDAKTVLKPTQPFVALGRPNIDLSYSPVRFDQGRIQVVDGKGGKLLDVDQLPGIVAAQIVTSGNVHGLWVAPAHPDGFGTVADIQLERDDVAFADASGILLSLDSREPGIARVAYPETKSWFEIMDQYRFWLLALAWLGLTVFVVYLFRKARQHRNVGA